MRHIIAYENALVVGEQFIVEGALTLAKDVIPVTWGFEIRAPIGRAHGLQRGDDGEVTIDLEFAPNFRGEFNPADVGATFYGNQSNIERREGVLIVNSVVVQAIAITPNIPWRLV